MPSTLNVFQRLALQWDQIHPYNAAQVLHLAGAAPELGRLQDAWHDALNDLGLGRVHLQGSTFRYECLNGEMVHYGVRAAPPGASIEQLLTDHLNRPFDDPAEPPFRPFVVADPSGASFFLGVSYHHWVADSVSIRTVLREWFARLFDPAAARRAPVRLPEGGYRRFFGPTASPAAMGHGLLTATRWASSLRKARRFDEPARPDFSVAFRYRHAADGLVNVLLAAARRRRVTLNDVFLASLARVADRFIPLRHRPRRHSVALGSIVDLRPYSNGKLDDAFGLFLGFTSVVCRHGDLADRERLLVAVARQNAQQKRFGLAQASALRMFAGIAAGKVLSTEGVAQFYHKNIPLAAGVSNVNLNRSWAPRYHPAPLLDYIRVSPTGPLMPLVVATTTLGRRFHFALTHRPSVVPCACVDALLAAFEQELVAYT